MDFSENNTIVMVSEENVRYVYNQSCLQVSMIDIHHPVFPIQIPCNNYSIPKMARLKAQYFMSVNQVIQIMV